MDGGNSSAEGSSFDDVSLICVNWIKLTGTTSKMLRFSSLLMKEDEVLAGAMELKGGY